MSLDNTTIFTYAILISSVSLTSGSIPLLFQWSDRLIRLFVSFGAGVMLAVAFIHMIPEAIEITAAPEQTGIYLLLGFLIVFIMEKFVMIHPCDEHLCDFHYIGLEALLGFSIHSIIMGVSLGSSMQANTLGFPVLAAIIIHKIPESFSLTSLLSAGQYSHKKIFYTILIFSLLVPAGMVLSVKMLHFSHKIIGYLVAMSAGTFIEIAACDILPELHRSEEWRYKNLIAFILGVSSMIFLGFIEQ